MKSIEPMSGVDIFSPKWLYSHWRQALTPRQIVRLLCDAMHYTLVAEKNEDNSNDGH